MTARWVCKRCFADNLEGAANCVRCGLTRGADVLASEVPAWQATATAAAQPAWHGLLRFWWVPVMLVVVTVGWIFAARRGDDGSITNAGTLSVYDLRVGDCFDDDSGGDEVESVDARPCGEAHEYEVYHDAEVSSASYPGEAFWDDVFVDECIGAFHAYVGEPYETSAIYATWYIPSEGSWAEGDRMITCVLYDPEEPRLTASLRGERR